MCKDERRVLDGDVRMMSVKSVFKSGGYYPSEGHYNELLNVLPAWKAKQFLLHERKGLWLSRAWNFEKAIEQLCVYPNGERWKEKLLGWKIFTVVLLFEKERE